MNKNQLYGAIDLVIVLMALAALLLDHLRQGLPTSEMLAFATVIVASGARVWIGYE